MLFTEGDYIDLVGANQVRRTSYQRNRHAPPTKPVQPLAERI